MGWETQYYTFRLALFMASKRNIIKSHPRNPVGRYQPLCPMNVTLQVKPVWASEIGTRTAEQFDGSEWKSLPSMSRAKVSKIGIYFGLYFIAKEKEYRFRDN